jgi:TRAP-type transport system periplasmic protein
MKITKNVVIASLAVAVLTTFSFQSEVQAGSAVEFKVGVLAPETTNWAKHLKKMVQEVKEKTGGKVEFKIFYNGSQGDEDKVLTKIRSGQLSGGIFTGKTLGEINGDIRAMELPFTFHENRSKAYDTLMKMSDFFNKKLANGGKDHFKNLGFFELGQIYFISQKESNSLEKLKGLKIWSWKGDPLVSSMIMNMNLVSVPLGLPDVLTSLSTGIVEAAYAPPVGILALQWHTKTKFLVDFPISYSVGAFLIADKKWKKLDAATQKLVEDIAGKYLKDVSAANIKDNQDALTALKSLGLKFIKFPDSDIAKSMELRTKIVNDLEGKVISKEALNQLNALIK